MASSDGISAKYFLNRTVWTEQSRLQKSDVYFDFGALGVVTSLVTVNYGRPTSLFVNFGVFSLIFQAYVQYLTDLVFVFLLPHAITSICQYTDVGFVFGFHPWPGIASE